MSNEKTLQSEDYVRRLIEQLDRIGIPVHGRNVALAKASGYSPSLISEVMNRKKTCTSRFFKLASDGLSKGELSVVGEPEEEYKKEEGVLVLRGLTPSEKLLIEAVLKVPKEKVGETFDYLVAQEQVGRPGKG